MQMLSDDSKDTMLNAMFGLPDSPPMFRQVTPQFVPAMDSVLLPPLQARDAIQHTFKTDAYKRSVYTFEQGHNKLICVVFGTRRQLVRLNDVVLPLEDFLDITHIKVYDNGVVCEARTHDCVYSSFKIPDITLPLVVEALTVIQHAFDTHSDDMSEHDAS